MKAHHEDWREAGKYPPIGCKEPLLLAWEFLRRNRDYATHYAAIKALKVGEFRNGIKKGSKSTLDATECTPAALPGETRAQYIKRMEDQDSKCLIAMPRVIFRNRWSLKKPVDPSMNYDPELVKFALHEVAVAKPKPHQRRTIGWGLDENQFALRFRLDMRLAPQLASAVAKFKEAAGVYKRDEIKATGLQNARADRVSDHAHFWLRCYDADAAGKQLIDSPKSRLRQRSGPSEISELFKKENSTNTDFKCSKKNPPDWTKRAIQYIDDKHYLKLLYPKVSRKEINAIKDLLKAWGNANNDS